ncbi:MAG: restriction endonuclease subunit S [Chitinophagales bacterium]
MRLNYKLLGKYIQPVNGRNNDLGDLPLVGLSIQKKFIPSIANTIGTDMTTYRIIERNQFAFGPVTSRNGDKITIALFNDYDKALISQAYVPFEVKENNELDPEYLMMWFRRPEFDRYARFKSHGSAREIFDWEEMCNTLLPVPNIDKQREIVKEYNVIQNRIALNQQLIQKLEETAQAIFNSYLISEEDKGSHRLGDLMEIKGGFSYNSEDLGNGNTYLLGMGCVSFSDRFVEEGMRLYSDNIPEQHIVKPKDIIIATRQQSENMPILGCPATIPPNLENKKLVIASNLYRVINKSKLNNELLYQILKSQNYQEHIKLHTKGTTVGMITKDAIEDYIFEAPSIEFLYNNQNNITKIIDNVFIKRDENQKLTELKELLLSRLATVE